MAKEIPYDKAIYGQYDQYAQKRKRNDPKRLGG